jgi:lipoyl(octanoyl) transferase
MAMFAYSASMSERPPWRLLVDEPAAGAWNMAVDEAVLARVAMLASPPTLRFYGWRPACLSLGYFQSLGVVDWEACTRYGVDVVRRPTGGRAILHARELTYSLALPLSMLEEEQGVLASYARLSRGLVDGLRAAGFPVEAASDCVEQPRHQGPACFDRPAQHEVLLHGRKVVGSAQVRRGGALLQHGSILLSPQVEETIRLLNLKDGEREAAAASMAAGVAGLEQVEGGDLTGIQTEITQAFSRLFSVAIVPGSLSAIERRAAQALAASAYASPLSTVAAGGMPEKWTRTR